MNQEQTQQKAQTKHTLPGEQRSHGMQSELKNRQVHRCANCDIEFFWPPTVVQGKAYCCTGCAAGGPCNCDYSLYRPVSILGVIHYEP